MPTSISRILLVALLLALLAAPAHAGGKPSHRDDCSRAAAKARCDRPSPADRSTTALAPESSAPSADSGDLTWMPPIEPDPAPVEEPPAETPQPGEGPASGSVAPEAFCESNGAQVGSSSFRACLKFARKAARHAQRDAASRGSRR